MARSDANRWFAQYLRGRSPLSRLYRAEPRPEPPASLDRAILVAARAHAQHRKRGLSPFAGHWAIPLSAAAVLALTVGLTLFMQREGVAPVDVPPTQLVEEAGRRDRMAAQAPTSAAEQLTRQSDSAARPTPETSTVDSLPERAVAPAAIPPAPAVAEDKAARDIKSSEPAGLLAAKQMKKEGTAGAQAADVLAVRVSGRSGTYQFAVTVRSPDTGCEQYADWWEVLSEDGKLLYRRILLHSHVNEQPFTRSGGPVAIEAATTVIVRAHMNKHGYGGAAMKGSPQRGFTVLELPAGFAAAVAQQPPRPQRCAF